MSDLAFDEFFESLAPAVQVSNADEPGFSEEEADSLDICARKNLDTVFSIISPQVVRKVDINYIYLRQRSTIITAVPVDLQLAWLFENFPQMASNEFVAKKDDMDYDVMRGIWHYGLDPVHSFSRYFHNVRFNLAPMALLMAENLPSEYCPADVRRFILLFVDAWLASLVDTGKLKTQSFKAQERFLKYWAETELDLLPFTAVERKGAGEVMKKLSKMSLPPRLQEKMEDHSLESVVQMRQDGILTDEEFIKFGPSLIVAYTKDLDNLARDNREMRASAKEIEEKELARQLAKWQEKAKHDYRRFLPWESRLLKGLVRAVDEELPHPGKVRAAQVKNPPAPQGDTWIDMDTWFELMKGGLEALEEEVEDIADVLAMSSLGN